MTTVLNNWYIAICALKVYMISEYTDYYKWGVQIILNPNWHDNTNKTITKHKNEGNKLIMIGDFNILDYLLVSHGRKNKLLMTIKGS